MRELFLTLSGLLFFSGCFSSSNSSQNHQASQSENKPVFDFSALKKATWEVRINHVETIYYYTDKIKYWNGYPYADQKKQSKIIRTKLSHGTGFFISPNKILTNFHVINGLVQNNKEARLLIGDKKYEKENNMKAKVLKVSAFYDLALLESERDVDDYLTISTAEADYSNLFTLGYPGNFVVKREIGMESRKKYHLELSDNYFHGDDFSGASGSPIVNEKNEVMAVHFSGDKISETYGINLYSINKFLNGSHANCDDYKTIPVCIYDEMDYFCEVAYGKKNDFFVLFNYRSYCNFGEVKQQFKN